MTEITVRDLAAHLLHLIELGDGDKKVRVSVMYDNCEHIQDLKKIHCFDKIDWITLAGDLNDNI